MSFIFKKKPVQLGRRNNPWNNVSMQNCLIWMYVKMRVEVKWEKKIVVHNSVKKSVQTCLAPFNFSFGFFLSAEIWTINFLKFCHSMTLYFSWFERERFYRYKTETKNWIVNQDDDELCFFSFSLSFFRIRNADHHHHRIFVGIVKKTWI